MSKLLALVAVFALPLVLPSDVRACAALGDKGPIAIRGEEALIVFDDDAKTEHFIRRAFFKDAPKDFGFLVPTPSKPELADATALVFDRLWEIYKKPPPPTNSVLRGVKSGPIAAAAIPPDRVTVVEQKTVAGLDASVLLASDPAALAGWLKAHHYPSSPALERWLAPYVKAGAYVTAFKLAGGPHAASTAVRMSFSTTTPIFPYSEPPGDGTPRPFRLSVVAKTRVDGLLGAQPWRPTVGYSDTLKEDAARALLDGVVPREAQKNSWLTVFDEPKSVRGKDDLMLRATKSVKVAPTITTRLEP